MAERRRGSVVAHECNRRRSPRFEKCPHPTDAFNGERVESDRGAAVSPFSPSISGDTNRKGPSKSLNTPRERNTNRGNAVSAEKPVGRHPRRSPRFEIQMPKCGLLENVQRRRSPRFGSAVSRAQNKGNEAIVVHCGGFLHWNVGKAKEGDMRKKEDKSLYDGTGQIIVRKSPRFPLNNEIQQPNNGISGVMPQRRSPRFARGVSDEDGKENEGNGVVVFANVGEDAKKRMRGPTASCMDFSAVKQAGVMIEKTKRKDENNEIKNSSGQSSKGEHEENATIIAEKSLCNGKEVERKRNASTELLKDRGGEKKRLREESESSKKKACEDSKVKHEYFDGIAKKKSGTLLGCSAFPGWSQDQEEALERAYLITKPSPKFWKEISKFVPGKSAKECFDRIHSIIPTPPMQQPRSRTKKKISPLGQFMLTRNDPLEQFGLKGKICGKKKSFLAHRVVRHILRKLVLATDKSLPQTMKPTQPNCILKSPCLEMNGESMPSNSRMPNIITPVHRHSLVSPEILKKVKNLDLHEKYIDRLHIREQIRGKKAALKSTNLVLAETRGAILDKTQTLKYARLALVSGARDALKQIQWDESHETVSECDDDDCDNDDNDNDGYESDFGTR